MVPGKDTHDALITKEQVMLEATLHAADALSTAVISGAPGQMKLALDVARALSELRRERSR
jgi:hypothetical protein